MAKQRIYRMSLFSFFWLKNKMGENGNDIVHLCGHDAMPIENICITKEQASGMQLIKEELCRSLC